MQQPQPLTHDGNDPGVLFPIREDPEDILSHGLDHGMLRLRGADLVQHRKDAADQRHLQTFAPDLTLIVGGVAEGCVQSGAALIGGETAEHPGMMPVEEYDLAGFAVGVVDKAKMIDNSKMAVGDVVLALPSTGIHSNGFSLCRKVFDIDNNNPELYVPREELDGKSIAEALLVPTKIYVKPVLALLEKVNVKGISHITGGGFYENIPRSIPDGLCAKIDKSAVKVLPIFDVIAKWGNIPERDMFNTYNMGVGMSIVVPAEEAELSLSILKENGIDAYVIGEIIEGEEKVIL